MPSMLATVLTSAITALVTTPTATFLLGPRLEARNRQLQTAHKYREECEETLRAVGVYAALLSDVQIPLEANGKIQAALRKERERWRQQIDQKTAYLTDNLHGYAMTFRSQLDMQNKLIQGAGAIRMVWISERPEAERLEIIKELSTNLHWWYFSGIKAKVLHPRRTEQAWGELSRQIDQLAGSDEGE